MPAPYPRARNATTIDFDVGVLLPFAWLSTGTSTLASEE